MAAKELVIDVKMQNQALKAEINRLNGQLDTLKNQAKSTGDGFGILDKAVGKFDLSGASAMGMVTKFAGALGVATTAGAVFNRMMETSQGLGDAVQKVQTQVNSAMDYFANSLANMDFNNFISGLGSVIRESGKLAEMLDDLNTKMQQLGVNNAKYNRDMANLQKEYYSTNDPKKRQDITKRMEELGVQHRKENMERAAQMKETGLQHLRKVAPGASDADIMKIITGYGEDQLKVMADRYRKNNSDRITYQAYSPSAMGIAFSTSQLSPAAKKYMATEGAKRDKIAAQLLDAQDEKAGQAAYDAREKLRRGLEMETQVINEETAVARKATKTQAALEAEKKKQLKVNVPKPTPPPAGSMAAYDAKISELKKKLTLETDPNNMVKIQKEINSLTEKKLSLQFQFNMKMWEAEHGKFQAVIDRKPLIAPIKLELDETKLKKSLEDFTKKFNEQMYEQGITNLSKGMVQANKYADILGTTADAATNLGDALYNVGAINKDVAAGFQMVGQIASTLQQVIPIIQALTMNEDELAAAKAKGAISGAAESVASIPVVGWLMVGAAVAACVAALAAMGNYASGGIVGGSSLVGDRVLARLNGGEMVLNTGQQARLFNLLDGTASLGGGAGEITWKLRGADLYGSLRNYNSIKKRVRG